MKRTRVEGKDEIVEKKQKIFDYLRDFPDQDEKFAYEFSGGISRSKKQNRYVISHKVTIDGKKNTEFAQFSDSGYGSQELARQAAEHYRRRRSNELGLTKKKKRVDKIAISFREFVAGVFDGDGSASIVKSKGSYRLVVVFCQSSDSGAPLILKLIEDAYGGKMNKKKKDSENHRDSYVLQFRSDQGLKDILSHLTTHSIIKNPQVALLLQAIEAQTSGKAIDEILYQQVAALKLLENYRKVPVDETRITNAYISGFFVAEGSCGLYYIERQKGNCSYSEYSCCLQFSQKSNITLLKCISKRFGNQGTVHEKDGKLIFRKQSVILEIINTMLPFICEPKKKQCEILFAYCTMKRVKKRYSESQHQQIEKWIAELKALKKT